VHIVRILFRIQVIVPLSRGAKGEGSKKFSDEDERFRHFAFLRQFDE